MIKRNDRVKKVSSNVFLFGIISICLTACGNYKTSPDELITEYRDCVKYEEKYYYSDKGDIFCKREDEKPQKIAKGECVFL